MKPDTLVDMLRIEAEAIGDSDLVEPDQDISEGDAVLGDAPRLVRQIWTLLRRYRREVMNAEVAATFAVNAAEREQAEQRGFEADIRADFLRDWMYAELRYQFATKPGVVGLRSGWRVTYVDEETATRRDVQGKIVRLLLGGLGGKP